ncbi:STAS domain-containing protein [Streptomyces narbonensis]|uniref:STAS domain-containing protein n=1 Tax=Streptomyces narbonensis TaxID=67333 RepID=UPI0033C42AAF
MVFEPEPDRMLARVSGEIDMEDADGLGQDLAAALDASACGLDVDLSGVTFCDSSGLHMLLRLNRRASQAGKSLELTTLGPRVARLLHLTGTEHLFTVHPQSPSGPGRRYDPA